MVLATNRFGDQNGQAALESVDRIPDAIAKWNDIGDEILSENVLSNVRVHPAIEIASPVTIRYEKDGNIT